MEHMHPSKLLCMHNDCKTCDTLLIKDYIKLRQLTDNHPFAKVYGNKNIENCYDKLLANNIINLLPKVPNVSYSDNAFEGDTKHEFVPHYVCKDQCAICKNSSRDCALHCIKCWPYMHLIFDIDTFALYKRTSKVTKVSVNILAKELSPVDTTRSKYDHKHNAPSEYVISLFGSTPNHYHSRYDVALWLLETYELLPHEIIGILRDHE